MKDMIKEKGDRGRLARNPPVPKDKSGPSSNKSVRVSTCETLEANIPAIIVRRSTRRIKQNTEVGTQSPATCAKSLGILGILGIHDPQKDNQSSAYESYALHTNFYLSDIHVTHVDDEMLIKARIGGICQAFNITSVYIR